MGQLLLPLFTRDTQMLTPVLGVREHSGTVYYVLSGLPIYNHLTEDILHFRYITSHLILQGLCQNRDIERVFKVSSDSIRRWKQVLEAEGERGFFKSDGRHGHQSKMVPEVLSRIQKKIDNGQSNYSIAKEEQISEGSIRYALKQGYLKKNKKQNHQNPQKIN
jgi:transposase